MMLSKEGVAPIKDVRNDGTVGKEEGEEYCRRGGKGSMTRPKNGHEAIKGKGIPPRIGEDPFRVGTGAIGGRGKPLTR